MKVKSKIYKGIEYVQFSELPQEQQTMLSKNLKQLTIKILVNDKIVSDCLQFRDYLEWYESVFSVSEVTVNDVSLSSSRKEILKKLALRES